MDRKDRNELVKDYYWFAVKQSKRYQNIIPERDDRISLAGEALIQAIDSYKPDKGANICTYISNCIKKRMLKEHKRRSSLSRTGTPLFLDARIINADYDTYSLYDVVPSKAINPPDWVIRRDTICEVRRAYASLPGNQKKVLYRKYICDENPAFEEIGNLYGRSKQWASSQERRGLANMKKYLKNLHDRPMTFAM